MTHAEVVAALDAMEASRNAPAKPPSSPSIALARPVKATDAKGLDSNTSSM
jgi:hypothetical protein